MYLVRFSYKSITDTLWVKSPFSFSSLQELVSVLRGKLWGDETVLLNIRKSGKEELYADLLCFLCFGSIR